MTFRAACNLIISVLLYVVKFWLLDDKRILQNQQNEIHWMEIKNILILQIHLHKNVVEDVTYLLFKTIWCRSFRLLFVKLFL